MLILRQLEIEGFGPYADPQIIDFPAGHGVTVIYGENMRGKTSLLNAIRYAFFGEVLGRGSRARKLHTISNRDRAAGGQFGFSVALTFEHDGDSYELARTCSPLVADPQSDSDYRQDVQLRQGQQLLGPQERERMLQMVFPHEVSRFFLFDGELLQEYEELLSNESDTGRKISEAIERILGVPILKRGRHHLLQLAQQAEQQAAAAAKLSQKTQDLGAAQVQAMDMRTAHQGEIRRLGVRLQELLAEQADLEGYLATVKRYSSLIDERQAALLGLEDARQREQVSKAALRRAMSDSWRSVLRETVRSVRNEARATAASATDQLLLAARLDALEDGRCGTCGQQLGDEARAHLEHLAPQAGSSEQLRFDAQRALTRVSDLERFDDTDNATEVARAWSDIRSAQIDQIDFGEKVRELEAAIADSNPDEIRSSRLRFAEVADKIAAVRLGIAEEQKKLDIVESGIQQRAKQLEAAGAPDTLSSQRKASLLRNTAEVLSEAIERYKAELRERVEATASSLFLAMTTEKDDYAGLTINEGYGLTIQHKDGRAEDARSAGAEHVVALALMGALQAHAPLQGPIVMDSPFGRLDGAHTSNVVSALPLMAQQVVLLVYENEVGVDQMRERLGASLSREYRLERISSRRTSITELK